MVPYKVPFHPCSSVTKGVKLVILNNVNATIIINAIATSLNDVSAKLKSEEVFVPFKFMYITPITKTEARGLHSFMPNKLKFVRNVGNGIPSFKLRPRIN